MIRIVIRLLKWAIFATVILALWPLMYHPQTPLPAAWNPTEPLSIEDAVTPLTDWKIRSAIAHPGTCADLIEHDGGILKRLSNLEESAQCVISQRVEVSRLGSTRVRPFETTCEIALRMAMWDRHALQPAAMRIFGQGVREIRHYSSYNCRRIRTSSGTGSRMSTHATARAVDVSGFVLEDGTLVDLRQHWNEGGPRSAFLREAQQSACDVFGLVLGPEYNALHADHFHIQLDGLGCR